MKIKAGLCIGYNGTGYSGLQLNGDLNTIEKAIAECLFQCKAISECNAKDPSKIHLKSSSRTDKGVHAAYNLICCKIETEITEKLFKDLKELLAKKNINLYKILRLTKSFLPTKMTSSRIYEYVIPTFFLQSSNFELEINQLQEKDKKCDKFIKRAYGESDIKDVINYKCDSSGLDTFKNIFTKFLGTKNFHNFTTLSNPKGKERFIKNINISEPYIVNDIEYIRIEMEGQSFLLHQIRKMTYFSILLSRYKRNDYELLFQKAFSKEYLHIPKGPGQYLLLDRPIFMSIRDKGKMIDSLDIDVDEMVRYKKDIVYNLIHDRSNLYAFLACLDSSRYHNEKLEYLKNNK
ncbi:hypothetical protein P3W45_001774 [Vairimorpha bombi]|jgi:tRNA pseudouridine38-40 synthase